MKRDVVAVILMLAAFILAGEKVAVLPEIEKPAFDMVVDNDELFVVQCATIYIYSLEDFKLKARFGRRGEGPREFKVHPQEHVHFSVQLDYITVDCGKKVAHYTRQGTFKNEIKIPHHVDVGALSPLAGQFVGCTNEYQDNERYLVLGLYDSNFNRLKEICRNRHDLQQKEIVLLRGTFHYKIYRNRIFVVYAGGDFRLDGFDLEGNLKFSIIEKDFEKRRVTTADRQRIRRWFDLYFKGFWQKNRERIKIKPYWPAIGTFFVDNDTIYIGTFVIRNGEWLFYLYDLKGHFRKKIYLPLVEHHIWAPFPYTIAHQKLYQIIENEETEQWELHITPIGGLDAKMAWQEEPRRLTMKKKKKIRTKIKKED